MLSDDLFIPQGNHLDVPKILNFHLSWNLSNVYIDFFCEEYLLIARLYLCWKSERRPCMHGGHLNWNANLEDTFKPALPNLFSFSKLWLPVPKVCDILPCPYPHSCVKTEGIRQKGMEGRTTRKGYLPDICSSLRGPIHHFGAPGSWKPTNLIKSIRYFTLWLIIITPCMFLILSRVHNWVRKINLGSPSNFIQLDPQTCGSADGVSTAHLRF